MNIIKLQKQKGRMDTRNLNFSYKKVSIKKLNEISANGGNVLKYLDKEHTKICFFWRDILLLYKF